MSGCPAGHPETARGRVESAHSRRLVLDGDYRKAVRAATAAETPDGCHPTVPVAAGDDVDWLLGQADEAGGPVAVLAVRGGRLVVYRLEEAWREPVG